jgi:hypothetical protein
MKTYLFVQEPMEKHIAPYLISRGVEVFTDPAVQGRSSLTLYDLSSLFEEFGNLKSGLNSYGIIRTVLTVQKVGNPRSDIMLLLGEFDAADNLEWKELEKENISGRQLVARVLEISSIRPPTNLYDAIESWHERMQASLDNTVTAIRMPWEDPIQG